MAVSKLSHPTLWSVPKLAPSSQGAVVNILWCIGGLIPTQSAFQLDQFPVYMVFA